MREWLKTLRTSRGLTQAEVATFLGIAQNSYAQIEAGTRQRRLSLSLSKKLSALFGISLEEVSENEENIFLKRKIS